MIREVRKYSVKDSKKKRNWIKLKHMACRWLPSAYVRSHAFPSRGQGLLSARISINRSTSASSVKVESAANRSSTCSTRDLPCNICRYVSKMRSRKTKKSGNIVPLVNVLNMFCESHIEVQLAPVSCWRSTCKHWCPQTCADTQLGHDITFVHGVSRVALLTP